MSLASRISNLFSGSPAPSRTAENSDEPRLGDDGADVPELFSAHLPERIHEGGARHTDTMAPKNDEEEGRPPYLHVCLRRE